MASTSDSLACPQCGAVLPPPAGFPQWCEGCEWNLDPEPARDAQSPLARIYRRLGARMGKSLFEGVMRGERLSPHGSAAGWAAALIAGGIYAVATLLAVGGAALAVSQWPNPFALIVSAVLVGSAWVARPRLPPVPDAVLDRGRYPALYALVDRVATQLGAPRADGVCISAEFNASIRQSGWRRRRFVVLGLPLLSVLTPQERIAVIAHELSHAVNGDPMRSAFFANAANMLLHWAYVLQPDEIWQSSHRVQAGPIVAILMIPFNLLLVGLSLVILAAAQLLLALLYRRSQRAEYFADLLAAQVSGASAMLATLRKLDLAGAVDWAIHRHANFRRSGERLFDEIRRYVRSLPARELQRLRRLGEVREATVDDTHPPTAKRIAFIEKFAPQQAAYRPTAEDSDAVDAELARLEPEAEEILQLRYDEAAWR